MPTPHESLQSGLKLHQSGDFAQAADLYRKVLADEPRNADAHHLLGLVALEQHDPTAAVAHFRTAIDCKPTAAQFHFHLGTALSRSDQRSQAVDAYRQAVRLDPRSAPMHIALGTVLSEMARLDEAEAAYREAVRWAPLLADAHNNLGNVLQAQQRFEEAAESFQAAIRLRPTAPEIHFNLGNCYLHQELGSLAAAAYRQALVLKDDFAMTHQNLGLALQQQQHFDQAIPCHRRAIALDPTLVAAHNALGVALHRSDQLEEAKTCYRRALELEPGDSAARFSLASALHTEGNLVDAETYYRAALEVRPRHIDSLTGLALVHMQNGDMDAAWALLERTLSRSPDSPDAHFMRGIMLLVHGKLEEGWKEFEYRFRRPSSESESFEEPRWDGKPLEGRTLLVHAEYGFGDMLQFIRYLPMVCRRAQGRVMVEVNPRIVSLLAHSGYRDLLPRPQPRPHFDVQVPMMSLPGVFGTTLETIPGDEPYLFADQELIRRWQSRLADVEGFKVGIHWQGNPKFLADPLRSMPLECFAPLAKVPGVTLVSLQKGPGRDQLRELHPDWSVVDLTDALTDFHETAALMKNLDLVITCDSSPGHLAGALGVPTWIALCVSGDWRWLRDRDDSPWYPSVRLFRQPKLHDWTSVFERMAEELAKCRPSAGP